MPPRTERGFDYKDYGTVRLENPITHSKAIVVPGYGGRMTSLKVAGKELFAGPRTKAELENDIWFTNAPLMPFWGKLREGKWDNNGHEHQVPLNFPPGDQPTDAIHGLVYNKPFKIIDRSRSSVWVEHVAQRTDAFPYAHAVSMLYVLMEHGMHCTMMVVNKDSVPMPIAGGMHFYFNTGNGAQLEISGNKRYMMKDGFLTGEIETNNNFTVPRAVDDSRLDECFELYPNRTDYSAVSTIHLADGNAIILRQDPDQMRFLQVFNHRQGTLALEPVTNPPGFDSGDRTYVQPGGHWMGNMLISYYQPRPAR